MSHNLGTCLKLVLLFFFRIVTALLISHYIPVTLFTLASFSSFSLALNHGNDRIGFLVTLFLVLVSMNISITNTSPGGNLITSVGNLLLLQRLYSYKLVESFRVHCLITYQFNTKDMVHLHMLYGRLENQQVFPPP